MNPLRWIDNELLNFTGRFDVRSGEVLRHPYESDHRGLKIKVIPSTVNQSIYHGSIIGSLHKYFNHGLHNISDFGFYDNIQVLNELVQLLDITKESVIRNLEFGVNIEIPIPAKDFIKKIVSTPTGKTFDFKVHGQKVGRYFAPAHGQYELKVYDKTAAMKADPDRSHQPPENKNLLRIEVKAKEMRFLKPYEIYKLSDLEDIKKVSPLVNVLLSMFNKLIINDIDPEKLTEKQRIKVKDYINPLYWSELNRKQREKELKRFKELTAAAPLLNIQATITESIISKWQNLLNSQQQKRDIYANFTGGASQRKKGTFTALEYRPYLSLLEGSKTQFLPTPKNGEKQPKKRYCKICGNDITGQRANSLCCSELIHGRQCRNKAGYNLRRERILKQRENEVKTLSRLCRRRSLSKMAIIILTLTTGEALKVQVNQFNMTPQQIRKVRKVQFSGSDPPGNLTTKRAKEFLKYLTIKNQPNEKRSS